MFWKFCSSALQRLFTRRLSKPSGPGFLADHIAPRDPPPTFRFQFFVPKASLSYGTGPPRCLRSFIFFSIAVVTFEAVSQATCRFAQDTLFHVPLCNLKQSPHASCLCLRESALPGSFSLDRPANIPVAPPSFSPPFDSFYSWPPGDSAVLSPLLS